MTAKPPTWDGTRWSDDAWCMRRQNRYATVISQNLYSAAEAEGWDMRYYVISKPMPRMDALLRKIMQ
jgi:hypothetical protein